MHTVMHSLQPYTVACKCKVAVVSRNVYERWGCLLFLGMYMSVGAFLVSRNVYERWGVSCF